MAPRERIRRPSGVIAPVALFRPDLVEVIGDIAVKVHAAEVHRPIAGDDEAQRHSGIEGKARDDAILVVDVCPKRTDPVGGGSHPPLPMDRGWQSVLVGY